MKKITAMLLVLVMLLSVSGCIKKADTYLFKSKDNSWSMEIPGEFEKDREDSDEQHKTLTTYFRTEKETNLVISELKDEKLQVDEELLKEEMESDEYIHVERYNTIDIKDLGKVYGAVVTDTATGMNMLYYRLKHEDNVISFILYRKEAFTPEQEAKAIAMISTFKGLKK